MILKILDLEATLVRSPTDWGSEIGEDGVKFDGFNDFTLQQVSSLRAGLSIDRQVSMDHYLRAKTTAQKREAITKASSCSHGTIFITLPLFGSNTPSALLHIEL